VIPTISESLQFCKACSNRSDTLANKWDIGFESTEGERRAVSCVPTALKCLYCLVISSSMVNLGSAVITLKKNDYFKKYVTILIYEGSMRQVQYLLTMIVWCSQLKC
jgi:hypothetical protein